MTYNNFFIVGSNPVTSSQQISEGGVFIPFFRRPYLDPSWQSPRAEQRIRAGRGCQCGSNVMAMFFGDWRVFSGEGSGEDVRKRLPEPHPGCTLSSSRFICFYTLEMRFQMLAAPRELSANR